MSRFCIEVSNDFMFVWKINVMFSGVTRNIRGKFVKEDHDFLTVLYNFNIFH